MSDPEIEAFTARIINAVWTLVVIHSLVLGSILVVGIGVLFVIFANAPRQDLRKPVIQNNNQKVVVEDPRTALIKELAEKNGWKRTPDDKAK